MLEVGQGQSQGKFFWSDGRMRRAEVGRRRGAKSGEVFLGPTEGQTADGGQKEK